jgi:alkylation response protein AidB-like acyl-CoA dehydrogenase
MSNSTETLQHIRASAIAFADEFLEPIAADLDSTGHFPRALVAEMARQQLLVLPTLKQAGFTAHVETLHTLSQSCPAVASILNKHALAAYVISKWGSDAQKAAYVDGMAQGATLGAIALHESGPALGGGPDALIGVMQGAKLTLNGKKTFVRNAGVADVYVGFASVGAAGARSVAGFIAAADAPGITVGPGHVTMGLRGCPVADVTFKNVVLEAGLLGTAADGAPMLAELCSALALGDAAQTIGIGKAASVHASAAARTRIQFRHPIADLQAVQQLLAEIATDTQFAWLGVLHAARLADAGSPFEIEAAMVKSFLGRFGQKLLIDAIQVEGGMGICETAPPHFKGTLPLARMFRDIAGTTLCDVPDDFPEALVAASF